jgi:hypothetical protein
MRTIVFLALTCFVSYIGAISNLGNNAHPLLFMVILYGSWIPFVLYVRGRCRRIAARKRRAYLQDRYRRVYLHRYRY